MKQRRESLQVWKKLLCVGVLVLLFSLGCTGKDVKAASAYKIKINKQMCCVTIYKLNDAGKYKPVKAMVCSPGWATETGTFTLGEKIRWHVLDGPCYGQYCTRIYGSVLFHSVWYNNNYDPGSLSVYSYNKLGTIASHGCVRLTVEDAKWIYDNVPSGTPVTIYNSSDPGPLGKPEAIKLPYSTPWDPTDIWYKENPWNNKKPSITGAKNQTVDFNSDFNVLKGVKAKNTTGFDATKRIKTQITYNGSTVKKVDTRMPGVYKVTYRVKDEIGRKAQKTVKINVTAQKNTPKISGVTDLYVNAVKYKTRKFALKNVSITQDGKKLKNKYIKVKFKKLKKNVFRITYLAQNASEQAKAVAKLYIDKKAPVFTGVEEGAGYTVPASQPVDKEYALSLIQVSDNLTELTIEDVNVTITYDEVAARYQVVYSVTDQAGNTTSCTIYITVEAPVVPTPEPVTPPASGSAVVA